MTTFTMRRIGGNFVVTGPDIEPKKFKTRREGEGLVHDALSRLTHQGDRTPSQAPDRRRNGKREWVNRAAKGR
jgi:hypothetical protein